MASSYIVGAKRSPIGRFLGGLSRVPATKIGASVAKRMLDDAGVDKSLITECYVGQVLQAGCGQNPARQVALGAGVPDVVSACTVNKVCGSGLQAVMFADLAIRAGDADVALAGGIESMSLAPFLSHSMRNGHKFGNVEFIDSMMHDGLVDAYDNLAMGAIAEETGIKSGATRKMQDEWSAQSHLRATAAEKNGWFNTERVAIDVPGSKTGPFNTDETVRADANIDSLAALKPAFSKEGAITAGNASAISDGAAMTLVVSEAGLKKTGLAPLAKIVATATSGGPPRELFFAPIQAIKTVCSKAKWDRNSVDLFEINEAFAAQMIACMKGLELPAEKVNVNGGAIALGHPIGASGARLLVTILYALKQRNLKRGIVTLCLGGGNAVAVAVELT